MSGEVLVPRGTGISVSGFDAETRALLAALERVQGADPALWRMTHRYIEAEANKCGCGVWSSAKGGLCRERYANS